MWHEWREERPSQGPALRVSADTCLAIKSVAAAAQTACNNVLAPLQEALACSENACVATAAVPPGYAQLQLDALDDGIWGADGFDM